METQIQTIESVAKDVFTLFGANTKTCKVEYNLASGKVRIIRRKDQITKDSIIFNRSTLEALSQKVNIKDLETRMIETIKRGLIKTLTKLGIKIVEPTKPEVYEQVAKQEVQEVTFVAEFVDTSELVKFNHENIDELFALKRPFKINIVQNMMLKEIA